MWRWLLAISLLAGAGCGPAAPACDATACAARGKLCDGDACVDPWRRGSPAFGTCAGEQRATVESLAGKAAAYDARAVALHLHPKMPWVLDAMLTAGVDPKNARAADVAAWWSGENDGLWSGLYLASQAFRYGATHDPAALATLDLLLDGETTRMRITGVSGLFVRQLIPPGVAGLACPSDPARYVPSPDKRSNRWVRIGAGGCAEVADGVTMTFSATTHCGLDAFAGWCFLDNVSQDEYVGHLFGLGAVAKLVDDAEVRGKAVGLLREIAAHLIAHQLEFVDWDGRPTTWGKIHPDAGGDTPGYLAVMAMSFFATFAKATGDPGSTAQYDHIAAEYPSDLNQIDIWSGPSGCTSNWNDLSMLAANFHQLLWYEHDPARRPALESAFDRELMRANQPRAGLAEKNAWFDFQWAAQKALGEGSDGPAWAAVEDGVCQLKQFPASNEGAPHDTTALAPDACADRNGESLAAAPFDTADRCPATFLWWQNPYQRWACGDPRELVRQPTGYLLPYWMGRYYGFIGEEL
jgi:hypothetical protein